MEPNEEQRKKRKSILEGLFEEISGLKGVAIVSREGLPIDSAFPPGSSETYIAALNATLLSMSEKAMRELKSGKLKQLYVKGEEGYLIAMTAGSNAILIVSTTADVRLRFVLADCERACNKLAEILN
jgi:predicted regulator of Ras-like GTPase activity (Roadblock/LC7/MglB family)